MKTLLGLGHNGFFGCDAPACPLLRPEPAHHEEESKVKADLDGGKTDKLWSLMSSYLSSGRLPKAGGAQSCLAHIFFRQL